MKNIFVQYDEWARMANRMFTYAFGRILSIRKNARFYANPLPNFKNTYGNEFPKHVSISDGLSLRKCFGSHSVDYEQLLNTDTDIIVDSYVQKWEYYSDYREDIRTWFMLDNISTDMTGDDELVIHIRETDYKAIGMVLNIDGYINAIKDLKYAKNTIVTDNCEADYISRFKDIGCRILSDQYVSKFSYSNNDNIMRDFIYLKNAKNILLSHSSFSWWASFLGCPENIYCPIVKSKSIWSENPSIDSPNLIMPTFKRIMFD